MTHRGAGAIRGQNCGLYTITKGPLKKFRVSLLSSPVQKQQLWTGPQLPDHRACVQVPVTGTHRQETRVLSGTNYIRQHCAQPLGTA